MTTYEEALKWYKQGIIDSNDGKEMFEDGIDADFHMTYGNSLPEEQQPSSSIDPSSQYEALSYITGQCLLVQEGFDAKEAVGKILQCANAALKLPARESAGIKPLLEDFLHYVGSNYTQHANNENVYWDRSEGEDRQMNHEGVVEDYLFDYSEFADAVLSSTKSVSAVESAGVLRQKLNDLIELVTDDKLVLHATPITGRPHDPNPEISRLRDEIVAKFSVAAPSSKEREIAFAEWIINENYKHYAGWWYKNGNNFANDPFSTGSLYDLYLESLNK